MNRQNNKPTMIKTYRKMNERMNKETFVAFATQKGGVGKSTVTALVANYVHNVMGLDVAVIDCDEPQHSIAGLRDKETALIEKNDSLKAVAWEHFRKSGRKAFPIIRSNAVKALDDADRLFTEDGYKPEIVFFDLPGTLKSDGVIKTLSQMDYIFTCSARPSFRRTPSCCVEAASGNCRKKSVPSSTGKHHGKPKVEYGGHR